MWPHNRWKVFGIVGVPEQENEEEQSLSGKGKAKANDSDNVPSNMEVFTSTENTLRSQLRSRVPPPPAPTMLPSSTATTTVLDKRRRNTMPRIEATHEWVHASVKIDGVWVPEPDKGPSGGKGKGKRMPVPASLEGVIPGRGAIAVFV